MATFSYLTIQAPSRGNFREKGSKFLAFAYPVSSDDEVKRHLKALKKEYFDARHHGYAYVLGPGQEKYRSFDDGEPKHSTGDPILGQIRSRNLTNVLIVVVRYFGGIKLGVGGLISAYKTAAEEALVNATIVKKEVTEYCELLFAYEATSDVMRVVKEFDLEIVKQDFTAGCTMEVGVKLRFQDAFFEKIKLLKALGIKVGLKDFTGQQ